MLKNTRVLSTTLHRKPSLISQCRDTRVLYLADNLKKEIALTEANRLCMVLLTNTNKLYHRYMVMSILKA